MMIKEALACARKALATDNIDDCALESELLLRHALNISRVQLYQELNRGLNSAEEKVFRALVKRRLRGEPTAYIIGHREFYGLDFYVNANVLIPRPESELLVAKTLELAQNYVASTIVDVGTGCGAIAISLALNLPQAKIYATDISATALEVAFLNCQKYGVINRVRLREGNLLEPLTEPVDLIVANLPYVRRAELARVNTLSFEPSLALDGGADGLAKIRCLCQQVRDKLHPEGWLLLEIGQGQRKAVTALLKGLFPAAELEVLPDLSGSDRVVSLTRIKSLPPVFPQ